MLTVFSFNIGEHWILFGKTMFELLDYITANIMLPLGGLLTAIFAGWVVSKNNATDELAIRMPFFNSLWRVLIRYITPLGIIIVFLSVIGLLG